MGDSDTFQFLVAIIAVGLALVGLLIMTVVAVLATWRQHGDTRSTHRATVEALSRIEEIVRSWAPGGPAPSLARAPLPPLEGAPNDSEALRSLLPLLSELDESFRRCQRRAPPTAARWRPAWPAARRPSERWRSRTERIIQGLRDFMEQVRAGNGENYNNRPPPRPPFSMDAFDTRGDRPIRRGAAARPVRRTMPPNHGLGLSMRSKAIAITREAASVRRPSAVRSSSQYAQPVTAWAACRVALGLSAQESSLPNV